MKERTVTQYSCDFCGKKLLQRSAMVKHELACTLNPNRKCRMCEAAGLMQLPVATLVALIPSRDLLNIPSQDVWDPMSYLEKEHVSALIEKLDPTLKDLVAKVEEAACRCPACMMAAFRQSGLPMGVLKAFDYKKLKKAFWADVNDTARNDERWEG